MWRKGQQRRVLVYRLIVLGTSDVFLNSLAFSKELMHLAFINAPTSVRKSKFLVFIVLSCADYTLQSRSSSR